MFNPSRLAYTAIFAASLLSAIGCGGKPKAPPPEAEKAGDAPPTVEPGHEDSGAPKDS